MFFNWANAIRTTLLALLIVCSGNVALADDGLRRSTSELIYVPAYPEVLTEPDVTQQMAVTIVVHNIDPNQSLTLQSVQYLDHRGDKNRNLLNQELTLAPLGSWKFVIGMRETTGEIGANFLVKWSGSQPTLAPIVEAIMTGGNGTQGLSFASRGKVISRTP
ncbi:MAG: DUF3124 domain-containing protein [Rhizobiaceae bacterium]